MQAVKEGFSMKIAVLGAGAMGCLYGAKLAEAGEDVTLLDVWKEHIDAIRKQGLAVSSATGDRNVPMNVASDPLTVGRVDMVIVFVKSYHTREAMGGALSLLHDDTIVFTVQNGLGNVEQLAELTGERRIIAGTSGFGATMIGPGHIRHAGTGATTLGELSGEKTARIERLVSVFNAAGLNPILADNLQGILWGKLVVNAGINAITALTRIKNGQILEMPELTALMEKAVEEALEVSRRRGIRLVPEGGVLEHVKEVIRNTSENISSMRQDVERGRRTEVEFINGAIVREGKALGVLTPVNFALTNLVKGLEAGAR
jgi:2-dehydropantoate 2-reductase